MKIVLASQSPRRRALLGLTGLTFETCVTDIDESQRQAEAPVDFVQRLSREKAQTAAALIHGEALILAADTIVVDGNDMLGKPRDAEHAGKILRKLRGRTHYVYTAVTAYDTASGRMETELCSSPVQMRTYTDDEINAYIASGDPFDKAGAYAIQNREFAPAAQFVHCFANVMGLPLCHITRMLKRMGYPATDEIADECQQELAYSCSVYGDILGTD